MKSMMVSQAGWSITVLWMILGIIFFMEGTGKIFGWFGKGGLSLTTKFFAEWGFPYPPLTVFLVGWTEIVGGTLLLLGLFTRLVAVPIAVIMFVALVCVYHNLNYYYPLLIYVCTLILIEHGGGRFSLDSVVTKSL